MFFFLYTRKLIGDFLSESIRRTIQMLHSKQTVGDTTGISTWRVFCKCVSLIPKRDMHGVTLLFWAVFIIFHDMRWLIKEIMASIQGLLFYKGMHSLLKSSCWKVHIAGEENYCNFWISELLTTHHKNLWGHPYFSSSVPHVWFV